ncbi:hypothetical protein VTN00DRAFT_4432 [Thermoascus crustaceus]|uniref:uncharacterized protein n=1 Tax=Thermoascus crustaceus TaxID=5088 RepID=UPI0037430D1C
MSNKQAQPYGWRSGRELPRATAAEMQARDNWRGRSRGPDRPSKSGRAQTGSVRACAAGRECMTLPPASACQRQAEEAARPRGVSPVSPPPIRAAGKRRPAPKIARRSWSARLPALRDDRQLSPYMILFLMPSNSSPLPFCWPCRSSVDLLGMLGVPPCPQPSP